MNLKVIGYATGIGFVLSVLIGLISRNSIIAILIHGLICAVVCAGMTAGVMFVFDKFLAEGAEPDNSFSAPKTGSVVDITLDDEKLPEDKNAPKFNVSENIKNMGDEEKNEKTSSAEIKEDAKEEEKTSSNENSDNGAFKPMTVASVAQSAEKSVKTGDGELDSLPDIGDFEKSAGGDDNIISVASSDDSGSISSSVAASTGSAKNSATFADGSAPSVKDAATIAQAIRTVLAKEG